jgi:hypothetical protein
MERLPCKAGGGKRSGASQESRRLPNRDASASIQLVLSMNRAAEIKRERGAENAVPTKAAKISHRRLFPNIAMMSVVPFKPRSMKTRASFSHLDPVAVCPGSVMQAMNR